MCTSSAIGQTTQHNTAQQYYSTVAANSSAEGVCSPHPSLARAPQQHARMRTYARMHVGSLPQGFVISGLAAVRTREYNTSCRQQHPICFIVPLILIYTINTCINRSIRRSSYDAFDLNVCPLMHNVKVSRCQGVSRRQSYMNTCY